MNGNCFYFHYRIVINFTLDATVYSVSIQMDYGFTTNNEEISCSIHLIRSDCLLLLLSAFDIQTKILIVQNFAKVFMLALRSSTLQRFHSLTTMDFLYLYAYNKCTDKIVKLLRTIEIDATIYRIYHSYFLDFYEP